MALVSLKFFLAASVVAAVLARWYLKSYQAWLAIIAPALLYLVQASWERVYLILATLPRDAFGAVLRVRLLHAMHVFETRTQTIPKSFDYYARKHPNKPCFLFEKKTYTFEQISQLSTQVGVVLRDKFNFKPGEVVGLLMPNKPEYAAIWLGAGKIGAVTALINTNVRLDAFIHSLKAAKCRALIFDSELASVVAEVQQQIKETGVDLCIQWQAASHSQPAIANCPTLLDEIEQVKQNSQSAIRDFKIYDGKCTDPLLYIYTSGTTGMPKAALMRHRRICQAGAGGYLVARMNSKTVLYCPLPLYHTAGGVIGVGCAFLTGTTVVIRTKFSASQYWDDCIYYGCTHAQYIGEMCRYLLAQPPKPTDTQHKVRWMLGNGLRPQIWQQFVDRFNTRAVEIYGSTEGNTNMVNFDAKVGACGVISVIIPMEMGIIKADMETGEPIRDKNGMCIRCEPDEPGQLVGIIDTNSAFADFAGYTDQKSTEKKVIRNVFSRGDAAFASGDILTVDKFGYTYFIDRIGDTFRWKGENVSTTEVEAALMAILGMEEDVVVYGVQIPGCEGKIGMASITSQKQDNVITSAEFYAQVEKRLPSYARPMFVRLVQAVEATGTLKLKKVDLRAHGFAPNPNDLGLFYMNTQTKRYEPLTKEIYQKIYSGVIRL